MNSLTDLGDSRLDNLISFGRFLEHNNSYRVMHKRGNGESHRTMEKIEGLCNKKFGDRKRKTRRLNEQEEKKEAMK